MRTKVLIIAVTLFGFIVSSLQAQQIRGKVTDTANQPLSGVHVILKGTQTSTLTNALGDYQITIDPTHQILVFKHKKFVVQEVSVQGRTIINVTLHPLKKEEKKLTIVEDEVFMVMDEEQSTITKKPVMIRGASYIRTNQPPMPNMYMMPEHNTEGYNTIHENGFKEVSINPLSTFSIDVDAASYSNVRRFINNGSLPPVDAVRIEEMINYFSYNYPQPKGDNPFSINTELSVCPWNTDNYLLHVGLQGKKMDVENLPASNLVFLIDVSGSMNSYNKLPLLKSSFALLLEQLRPSDRVAIVVYTGSSGLVLPSTPGSEKQKILDALNNLKAGGSTAGGAGLQLAYKTAEENFMEQGNNRIILATDGDFNVGASSNAEMERLIEKEREKGIFISVLGFGMGNYKDDKAEIIANKGNGNYSYIDNLQEAKKVLVNEFGGTLFTIAKDVKFQLEFNPATVVKYRLIGYENRLLNEEDFQDDKKDAGEMGAGHTVTALYEIIPAKKPDSAKPLKYQRRQLSDEALSSNDLITLKLRYKAPDGYQSKLIEQVVKNTPLDAGETSNNFRFSAAVAQFGMLLRDSEFKGTTSFESAIELANGSKGTDEEGYRGEMIRLMKSAELLKRSSAQK
ncbi:MAG: von Willebrand factor type A domain-containing protein [Salinivirgaceae bacterium]